MKKIKWSMRWCRRGGTAVVPYPPPASTPLPWPLLRESRSLSPIFGQGHGISFGQWDVDRSDDRPVMSLNLRRPLVFLLVPCHHHWKGLPWLPAVPLAWVPEWTYKKHSHWVELNFDQLISSWPRLYFPQMAHNNISYLTWSLCNVSLVFLPLILETIPSPWTWVDVCDFLHY